MKIAILGGGFDPPHLGHLIVAQQVREYLKMDEVWLMPVYSHPLYKDLSPAPHRLAMTKMLESAHIKCSEFEMKRDEKSYTIDTLQLLQKEHPQHDFSWCAGTDVLPDFHKWKDWKKLITNYQIIVYPRGFGQLHISKKVCQTFECDPLPPNITVIEGDQVIVTNISSTIIKQRVKEGKSIRYLVLPEVERYIKDKILYE